MMVMPLPLVLALGCLVPTASAYEPKWPRFSWDTVCPPANVGRERSAAQIPNPS